MARTAAASDPMRSFIPTSRADRTGEVLHREIERAVADLRSRDPAVEVVGIDVDPAPQARETRQVGGVVVGRPLELDVHARAALEGEIAVRVGGESTEPSREVLAS